MTYTHVQCRYGECLADTCVPVPCRWDRMVTELGETGALNIKDPEFLLALMGQSNPVPDSDNTLTITLKVCLCVCMSM